MCVCVYIYIYIYSPRQLPLNTYPWTHTPLVRYLIGHIHPAQIPPGQIRLAQTCNILYPRYRFNWRREIKSSKQLKCLLEGRGKEPYSNVKLKILNHKIQILYMIVSDIM